MLTGDEIIVQYNQGNIIFEPFWLHCVGPNSIDIHIGPHVAKYDTRGDKCASQIPFSVDDADEIRGLYRLDDHSENGFFHIGPGEQVLCHTLECFGSLCGYIPLIYTRSTAKRIGLDVCGSAGFGDIGYVNKWTLEVVNTSPFSLLVPVGARIAQVAFVKATGYERDFYTGSYQGALSPPYDKHWKPADMLPKALDSGKVGDFMDDVITPTDNPAYEAFQRQWEALNKKPMSRDDVIVLGKGEKWILKS